VDVAGDVEQHVDPRPAVRDLRALPGVQHVEVSRLNPGLLLLQRLEACSIDVRGNHRRAFSRVRERRRPSDARGRRREERRLSAQPAHVSVALCRG